MKTWKIAGIGIVGVLLVIAFFPYQPPEQEWVQLPLETFFDFEEWIVEGNIVQTRIISLEYQPNMGPQNPESLKLDGWVTIEFEHRIGNSRRHQLFYPEEMFYSLKLGEIVNVTYDILWIQDKEFYINADGDLIIIWEDPPRMRQVEITNIEVL